MSRCSPSFGVIVDRLITGTLYAPVSSDANRDEVIMPRSLYALGFADALIFACD